MSVEAILKKADALRWELPQNFHDQIVEQFYEESSEIADRHLKKTGKTRRNWELYLDKTLTNRWVGIPIMILLLGIVLWITIAGANLPSAMLAGLLVDTGHPFLKNAASSINMWPWLSGILIDGMYLTTAWVISVMLPPMAIFFPLFTILEDLGYLPRVAFNLDNIFQRCGAHGKQALTMCMGLGCNAAGVISTRIIDSPRERLIAIITNNFSLCNGRWPTQILVASIFIGALVPAAFAGTVSALAVLTIALLGFLFTFLCSLLLSRTILRGETSTFSLELPPYRPPNILRTLYTSLIDRTIFVLWRAIIFALPAGAAIWLVGNIYIGEETLAVHLIDTFQPFGLLLGLDGVILLAYLVAIPANEIVIPTILMLLVLTTGVSGVGEQGAGVMFETEGSSLKMLLNAGGWTLKTAVCLLLFSLCHNPCSTTIYTIYKETRSVRWTMLATLLPLAIGIVLCVIVALVWP